MSNDKKPKKAKPPVVHGATRGAGNDLASKLSETVKKAPAAAGKKK